MGVAPVIPLGIAFISGFIFVKSAENLVLTVRGATEPSDLAYVTKTPPFSTMSLLCRKAKRERHTCSTRPVRGSRTCKKQVKLQLDPQVGTQLLPIMYLRLSRPLEPYHLIGARNYPCPSQQTFSYRACCRFAKVAMFLLLLIDPKYGKLQAQS